MQIEFSEHRELLPATDETDAFWHRVLIGRFEHQGQQYAVMLSLPDEDLTPEKREVCERMLVLQTESIVMASDHGE